MIQQRFRVYHGPEDTKAESSAQHDNAQHNTVTLPLSEVATLLADAVQNRRTWLGDFADDEVTVTSDLYEVLMAYQFFRRPSA